MSGSPVQGGARDLADAARDWFIGWGRILLLGAQLLVLALAPSSYGGAQRRAIARHIYLDTVPILLWFTILSSLIGLVLIRIVVVTAESYGLTQYALQMVVRVLVLELIPLTAAVFVALRCTLDNGAEVAALRARGAFEALRREGVDPLQREVLPRVVSGAFAVVMLASVSSVVVLCLAYLLVYGFTLGGFEAYTRTVGQVFIPTVTLIFLMKTFLLSLAVSLMPLASVLHAPVRRRTRTSAELQSLVRMFLLILLIEAVSLVGNYY